MAYIDLDMVELPMDEPGLMSTTVEPIGPNGWAVVRMSGPRATLEQWLRTSYDEALINDIIDE